IQRLKGWGAPPWLAILLVVIVVLLLILGLTSVVGGSVAEFSGKVGDYDKLSDDIVEKIATKLEGLGLKVDKERLKDHLDSEGILKLISGTLVELLGALSNLVVILIMTVFMLIEAEGLPTKLRRIAGDPAADLGNYLKVSRSVNDFIRVKTLMSLLTGIGVSIFLLILGVPYPFLWGVVAFLFNYVPQVGSLLAAVPAVLLALITRDLTTALITAGCYVGLNSIIGNVLEPRLMGKALGLSIFVTVISLVFWNWVLGPVGMLLSIPLTMIVKILLEHSEDLKPAAILLGSAESGSTEASPLSPDSAAGPTAGNTEA
ncbi:MAG: AI-2E family transporter, partial [Planctomycetota bacterium]